MVPQVRNHLALENALQGRDRLVEAVAMEGPQVAVAVAAGEAPENLEEQRTASAGLPCRRPI